MSVSSTDVSDGTLVSDFDVLQVALSLGLLPRVVSDICQVAILSQIEAELLAVVHHSGHLTLPLCLVVLGCTHAIQLRKILLSCGC